MARETDARPMRRVGPRGDPRGRGRPRCLQPAGQTRLLPARAHVPGRPGRRAGHRARARRVATVRRARARPSVLPAQRAGRARRLPRGAFAAVGKRPEPVRARRRGLGRPAASCTSWSSRWPIRRSASSRISAVATRLWPALEEALDTPTPAVVPLDAGIGPLRSVLDEHESERVLRWVEQRLGKHRDE
jgi:hypothetical protein